MRSAVNKQDGDGVKNEVGQLKNKIDSLTKQHTIEMMQAKQTAIRNANQMIEERLSKAKFAYEEELEHLCK